MTTDLMKRKAGIIKMYEEFFNRTPDTDGLNNYLYSDLTLGQIEQDMKKSMEYLEAKRKEDFFEDVGALGNSELLMMGSSPTEDSHIETLKKAGVKSMLCLDETCGYDHDWCDSFLHVPLKRDELIPKGDIDKCLSFILNSVVFGGQKLFVHSERGVSRSPMMIVLFLVADKKLQFYNALKLVSFKQPIVNPGRELVNADSIDIVYSIREKFNKEKEKRRIPPEGITKTTPQTDSYEREDIIEVRNNLFVGQGIADSVLVELKDRGVKTLFDINVQKVDLSTRVGSWFRQTHIPAYPDQLEVVFTAILRSLSGYMESGPVYLHCKDLGVLIGFAETYMANLDEDSMSVSEVDEVRKRFMRDATV